MPQLPVSETPSCFSTARRTSTTCTLSMTWSRSRIVNPLMSRPDTTCVVPNEMLLPLPLPLEALPPPTAV